MILETIKIVVKNPENNQAPFKVKPVLTLKGIERNKTFEGYFLEFRIHPCDAIGQGEHPPFEYQAWLYSSNVVIVEAPVLDYTDMGKDDIKLEDSLEDNQGELDEEDGIPMAAYDDYCNQQIEDQVNKKEFPIKKQYRLEFDGDVMLSSSVLESHQAYSDSGKLHTRPVAIEYVLENRYNYMVDELTWDDLETTKLSLPNSDTDSMVVEKDVIIVPQPTIIVQRLVIELADLSKDAHKKGRVVKAADVSGATAMLQQMGGKKKKKKATS